MIRKTLFVALIVVLLGSASDIRVVSSSVQAAQQPTPAPQGQPSPPSAALLKQVVAFLVIDAHQGEHRVQVQGTAFFVLYEDKRLGEQGGFVYAITNRHAVEPAINGSRLIVDKTSLRLNLKSPSNGRHSEQAELPIGSKLRWYFSGDPATDLAAMPVAPDEQRYDYKAFPVSLFATRDVVRSESISEGDPVVYSGFFAQFPGQDRIEPIIRQGIVAMIPEEPMETTLGKPGHVYLADVHTFHGNSGSPVFVNLGGLRFNSIVAGFNFKLLGVVSGYMFETEDFQIQVATTLTGKGAANSGISMIVPADDLKQLLEGPELKALRDAEVARLNKR